MPELLEIMLNSIAPIFVVVGLSALYARQFNPDPKILSSIVLYLFSPFLVFMGLAYREIGGDEALQIMAVAVIMAFLLSGIGLGIGRALRLDKRVESAFVLTVMLVNAANYGIPLNTFAFGDTPELAELAQQRAIIFYVASVMISNTFGIFFASRGSVSAQEAVMNIFKVPLIYAAVPGLIVSLLEIELPLAVSRPVNLLGNAAIPGMLTLLGFNLARASVRGRLPLIALATGVKLVAAPFFALVVASLVGLSGMPYNISVVEASMPTAVIAGVLAIQFDADSDFVTSVIVISTLTSILTLSILLSVLT